MQPPSVQDLRQSLTPTDTPQTFKDSSNQARSEKIELDGREQFFQLRGNWSGWLIGWISALIIFEIALTLAVGLGYLNYLEYKWFLPIVFGQSFLQIIGMGVVIVKFLYAPLK